MYSIQRLRYFILLLCFSFTLMIANAQNDMFELLQKFKVDHHSSNVACEWSAFNNQLVLKLVPVYELLDNKHKINTRK